MGIAYQAVQWNRQKRVYDTVLALGVGVFLALFIGATKALHPAITDEILLMRATACAAFILLHVILCIGPLCRLNPRFLPLLYNRRHAGVTMALLAFVHAALAVLTYHAGGDVNAFVSIFVSEKFTGSLATLPFQPFGFVALLILLLMAATSHDFWLVNLTAPVWKTLHMLVYLAYASLIAHVTFGALQGETHPLLAVLTAAGFITVLSLHVASATKERATDQSVTAEGTRLTPNSELGARNAEASESLLTSAATDGYVDACAVADIRENRARIVCLSGERVAIFKYDGKISAVSNVCQHQNGPLGEGKIVNGCVTCPWHGYQYNPDTGASPPPFVEKVPTFNVLVKRGRVFVHPRPNPPGTRAEPALVQSLAPSGILVANMETQNHPVEAALVVQVRSSSPPTARHKASKCTVRAPTEPFPGGPSTQRVPRRAGEQPCLFSPLKAAFSGFYPLSSPNTQSLEAVSA